MRNRALYLILIFICSFELLAQDSNQQIRAKATENIADVLFDTKAKPIRDRLKSFENANGIKIQYKVEDESLDKLGGLSEHLFKLFQSFTTNENTNVRTITAEFSVLNNEVLSDLLTYKTNATSDLRKCQLPESDTQKMDSLYNKFLHGSPLSASDIDYVPENLDGLYSQASDNYEQILARHGDCPGIFDADAYTQHVINTRQSRFNSWTNDANALSLNLSANYSQISSDNSVQYAPNQGNTGVNMNLAANQFQGHYVMNLNNSVNACTQEDMEVRCRMLYGKTGKRFLFITQNLDYYLPLDSLDKFRDAATQTFTNNLTDDIIVGLYLNMKDNSSTQKSLGLLLVKQINGTWLTTADINFAKQNNGGEYSASTFHKFKNLYKNIPKPIVICYQVAKVNGLLTTSYFKKGDNIKGREQIYFHVFRLDKAFDEIKQLDDQRKNLISAIGNANGWEHVNNLNKEIDATCNKIKIAYLKAAIQPSFNEAETHFKEVYLQRRELAEVAALQHVRDKYGLLYANNKFDDLINNIGLPDDIKQGSCKTNGNSDVIGGALGISSLILSPVGLDFIPDALAVAYFAATDQTLEMMLASASFLVPGNLSGIKKTLSSAADAFQEINAGNKLLVEAGQIKAIEQDVNYITGTFHLNPENVDASLVSRINNNPTVTDNLLPVTESQAKVWSNTEKLEPAKRIEFVKKCYDDAEFRTKCLSDPDEVLRWGGIFIGSYGKNFISGLNGFSDNIHSIIVNFDLNLNAFKALEEKATSALTTSEKILINSIRESVSQPNTNTLMQKVIPKSDIEKYLNGTYKSIKGFMSTAADSKHLQTYEDIYYGMRLDYTGSKFSLSDGSCGVIRFKADNSSSAIIPRNADNFNLGTEVGDFPFTGHGFTSASNSRLGVPEWKMSEMANMDDGAELWEVFSNGSEVLKARFSKSQNQFVALP